MKQNLQLSVSFFHLSEAVWVPQGMTNKISSAFIYALQNFATSTLKQSLHDVDSGMTCSTNMLVTFTFSKWTYELYNF